MLSPPTVPPKSYLSPYLPNFCSLALALPPSLKNKKKKNP